MPKPMYWLSNAGGLKAGNDESSLECVGRWIANVFVRLRAHFGYWLGLGCNIRTYSLCDGFRNAVFSESIFFSNVAYCLDWIGDKSVEKMEQVKLLTALEAFGPHTEAQIEEMKQVELIDFLAYILYQQDGLTKGYINPRWACSNEKVKAKFRAIAKAQFQAWQQEELDALNSRLDSFRSMS